MATLSGTKKKQKRNLVIMVVAIILVLAALAFVLYDKLSAKDLFENKDLSAAIADAEGKFADRITKADIAAVKYLGISYDPATETCSVTYGGSELADYIANAEANPEQYANFDVSKYVKSASFKIEKPADVKEAEAAANAVSEEKSAAQAEADEANTAAEAAQAAADEARTAADEAAAAVEEAAEEDKEAAQAAADEALANADTLQADADAAKAKADDLQAQADAIVADEAETFIPVLNDIAMFTNVEIIEISGVKVDDPAAYAGMKSITEGSFYNAGLTSVDCFAGLDPEKLTKLTILGLTDEEKEAMDWSPLETVKDKVIVNSYYTFETGEDGNYTLVPVEETLADYLTADDEAADGEEPADTVVINEDEVDESEEPEENAEGTEESEPDEENADDNGSEEEPAAN